MTAALTFVAVLLSVGPIQGSEPTIAVLRARAQERMRRDLAREVAQGFPGAVDHNGRLLVDTLRNLKLL